MKRMIAFVAGLILFACASYGADEPEPLEKRWAAWQEYAKTYKASALFPPLVSIFHASLT